MLRRAFRARPFQLALGDESGLLRIPRSPTDGSRLLRLESIGSRRGRLGRAGGHLDYRRPRASHIHVHVARAVSATDHNRTLRRDPHGPGNGPGRAAAVAGADRTATGVQGREDRRRELSVRARRGARRAHPLLGALGRTDPRHPAGRQRRPEAVGGRERQVPHPVDRVLPRRPFGLGSTPTSPANASSTS